MLIHLSHRIPIGFLSNFLQFRRMQLKSKKFFFQMCSVNRFGDPDYSATVKDDTGSLRAQAPHTKTSGVFSDDELLERSTTFIHNLFKKRYQDKKKRDTNLTLHQFVNDMLSSGSTSLPSFIPGLQKILERELNREQIPQSKSWLSNRWSRIKRSNNYDLN